MATSIILNIIGALTFLFIFWRRLKEDYDVNLIFTTAVFILIGILIGDIISRSVGTSWWFWFKFIGVFAGVSMGIFRYKLRFFETIEAGIISLIPWLAFIFLSDSITNSSPGSLIGTLVLVVLILLFLLSDKHYKNLSWYKSGRIGFSGLSICGLFFLIRAFVAVAFPHVLSFVGKYDAMASGLIAFAAFLAVFNLAQTKT